MENQHRLIKGYRDLTEVEIAQMNTIKATGIILGELIEQIKAIPGVDQRWVSIGVTDLQKGLMSLTRAIAKPEGF